MNIKINGTAYLNLVNSSVGCIEFGTKGGSDKDLLFIVPPNMTMDGAIQNRDHFLFYKNIKKNTDVLFCTPRLICNSLITGSSDLPFWLLKEGEFKGINALRFLNKIPLEDFNHFKMIKCLLGCAERDLKQSKGGTDEKKLKWANLYFDYSYKAVHSKITDVYCENICTLENIKILRTLAKKWLPVTISLNNYNYIKENLDLIEVDDSIALPRDFYFEQWRDSL